MATGESKRHGYIDGSIKELNKEDPKYLDCVSDTMLIMNWILNSIEKELRKVLNNLILQKNFGSPLRQPMPKSGIMPGSWN